MYLLPRNCHGGLLRNSLRWYFKVISSERSYQTTDTHNEEKSIADKNEKTGVQGKEIETISSSLRADAVAAIGLKISRKIIWELSLDGLIYLNGSKLEKKSTKVKQGDVIEVDSFIRSREANDDNGDKVMKMKRGRVVVKEIGPLTRKGKYRLLLVRYKHYELFRVTDVS